MLKKKEQEDIISAMGESLAAAVNHVDTCPDDHHHPLDKDGLLFFYGGWGAALMTLGVAMKDVNKVLEVAMDQSSKKYKISRE